MCRNSLTFCMLLLIASSLALQPSSTNDDNKDINLTVREFDEDTKRNYDIKAELCRNDTNDNKALVRYFCLLTSDFWLSVMSFDMWWTFRNFWSLQRNMEQQKRKKFIYSTIAWGGPFILTIICIIMEFVPSESKNLIRPGLCISNYDWFYGDDAYRLYSFGPECICISSSICLSIYTALKIMQYEEDTTRHLGYLERQSFNKNKQWINLYLKLSIVLSIIKAIRGIILIIWEFWLHYGTTKKYIAHILDLMTAVQHIGTFVIFVCKKTTMQLLLKHLCQNHGSISKRSRQNRSNRYELQQLRHH